MGKSFGIWIWNARYHLLSHALVIIVVSSFSHALVIIVVSSFSHAQTIIVVLPMHYCLSHKLSSATSDVYKRQSLFSQCIIVFLTNHRHRCWTFFTPLHVLDVAASSDSLSLAHLCFQVRLTCMHTLIRSFVSWGWGSYTFVSIASLGSFLWG